MKKAHLFVRVNGRGNAWPMFLGGSSEFYSTNSKDLSNASFSLIGCNDEELSADSVEWEVLIDAGHHTVPFLIQNGNRIPNAVLLTHGHMDHTLGLDWVAQSKYRLSNHSQKLTVYATSQVWAFVQQSYPHLSSIIDFIELLPGLETEITQVPNLFVTAYPVFHGESARGACMLLFKTNTGKTALFTGDMLCPILRKQDYDIVNKADILFIDANNRYPYPKSYHGSIIANHPNIKEYKEAWLNKASVNYLITPHARHKYNEVHHRYFEEFVQECKHVNTLPISVFEFCKLREKTTCLVHYGGAEDIKYYNAEPISTSQLKTWVEQQAKEQNMKCKFDVPEVGDLFKL